MSYAIMRVQKVKSAADVSGLQIHNRREKKSRSNPDIDYELTAQNYELIDTTGSTYNQLIDKRIAEGYTSGKTIRKDSVRLCEMLFTSDDSFFDKLSQEKQREYFSDCLKWARNTFGEKNLIYAVCHNKDELGAPHMHVGLVPITEAGGLSANTIFNGRRAMQDYQNRFHKAVGLKWGLERGTVADLDDPNAERPRKNERHQDFKQRTRAEAVSEAKAEAEKIKTEVCDSANRRAEEIIARANRIKDEALMEADRKHYRTKAILEDLEKEITQKRTEFAEIESNIEQVRQDRGKFSEEYREAVREANAELAALRKERTVVIKGNREFEALAREIEQREREQTVVIRRR